MENESAKKIQKWWRKKIAEDRRLAEKARNLIQIENFAKITLRNNSLIARLNQLRQEKANYILNYEKILNMPAREVNDFMQKEYGNNRIEKLTLLEEKELEKRNEAARIIQRSFHRFHSKQIAKNYLRSLRIIKPSKRIQYLEQLNEKLSTKKSINVVPLEEIRSKLEKHKLQRDKDAVAYAKRQQLVQNLKLASISLTIASLDIISAIQMSNLSVSDSLTNYIAALSHREAMEKIEEDEWA